MFFAFFLKGRRMELYEVTTEYVEYLQTYEPTKVLSNSEKKSNRKFLGIVVQKNGYQYVVPLSSPKYKKDYEIEGYTGDTLPIDFSFISYAGRIKLLKGTTTPVVYMYEKNTCGEIDFIGKLQCNNMIPVPDSELVKVDVTGTADIAYKTLLNKQIQYLRKNQKQIINQHINPVYINRKKNRMDIGYIKNATPDFALLEKKCTEWEIKKNS